MIAAVLDVACGRPELDGAHVALVGVADGGNLVVRAAAHESRVGAVVCDPGVVRPVEGRACATSRTRSSRVARRRQRRLHEGARRHDGEPIPALAFTVAKLTEQWPGATLAQVLARLASWDVAPIRGGCPRAGTRRRPRRGGRVPGQSAELVTLLGEPRHESRSARLKARGWTARSARRRCARSVSRTGSTRCSTGAIEEEAERDERRNGAGADDRSGGLAARGRDRRGRSRTPRDVLASRPRRRTGRGDGGLGPARPRPRRDLPRVPAAAEDARAPTTRTTRLRPDLEVEDMDVAQARIEALGGRLVEIVHERTGDTHRRMADPEGNEFTIPRATATRAGRAGVRLQPDLRRPGIRYDRRPTRMPPWGLRECRLPWSARPGQTVSEQQTTRAGTALARTRNADPDRGRPSTGLSPIRPARRPFCGDSRRTDRTAGCIQKAG